MNIFHALERVSWLINKRRTKKLLIDYLDFKVISRPRYENFSLLVQGPITKSSQKFFFELMGAYRDTFGGDRIRVACSTITDDACDYLIKSRIRWFKSTAEEPGPGNIFYQAKSVTEGLKICEYENVVKVRNDQFIQRWDFIDAHKDQIHEDKIFVCGYTLIDPLFHVADMVNYGSKNNLENIWENISNKERANKLLEKFNFTGLGLNGNCNGVKHHAIPPEVMLGLSIASLHGCTEISSLSYLEIIKSRLICSSNADIGLQWAKHNSILDFHRVWTREYRETIDYQKWLAIKNGCMENY